MADYEKLLQVPRGTKARLETIKLNLLVNTIVYATDTKELGIKLSDGNIEYFKNATDIDAIVDTLEISKQDKLVAGENITIEDNVISATGGGLAVETWNTATKTLALSDSNKLFKCSHTANQTLTIPTNATVAFPIGTMITFLLTSTNKVTFSGASGVTLTSIDSLVELATQYAMASLIKTDTNTWQLVGALE